MPVANPLCWFCHGAAHLIKNVQNKSSDYSKSKAVLNIFQKKNYDLQ
jgi:protein-disulfide isomerase-like protein with CxxC motif